MDKYLEFLIKNYSDIRAFQEVVDIASKKLPEWVDNQVADAVLELRHTFFRQQKLEVETFQGAPWWYDSRVYSKGEGTDEKHKGWFFMIDGGGWKTLFQRDSEDPPFLYLSVATDGIGRRVDKNRYVDRWASLLRPRANKLRRDGIDVVDVEEVDYNEPYLAWYFFYREVSMDILSKPGELHRRIQNAVKKFTMAVLPILRRGKQAV